MIHLGFSSRSLISQEAFESSVEKSVSWQALPRPGKQGQGRAESHRKNLGIHSHPQSCLDSFQSLIKATGWLLLVGKGRPSPPTMPVGRRPMVQPVPGTRLTQQGSLNKHSPFLSHPPSAWPSMAIPRASHGFLRVCFPALLGLPARPA